MLDRIFPVAAIATGTIVFYLELLGLIQQFIWLLTIRGAAGLTP